MKPRESTIQAKEFQAAALRRQLAQFERMMADLEVIRAELGKQIEGEERRNGVTDPSNFAYSTVARAARERRRNLSATIADLTERRDRVLEELGEIDGFFNALTNAGELMADALGLPKARHAAA
ncbi:flagellar export protein FliJ [Acuticoccus mangrovi]|uniref:Flagellar export protein FliJ n=1 Tax=Acuticoccus mangrovi TaxID=2796142 RepID=A0A934IMI3_9HYPH|nr:flagellar export protein FliJ [Acuticoccus mangrovi]MBJ3775161.1 flagellar export protein FliJ [Acuticoccus mangrovi]